MLSLPEFRRLTVKVSLNSIRAVNRIYGSAGDPAPNGIDDLVHKIGAQLGAVEEIIPYGERFKGVLVAKVVSCEDHPDADRLHVCKVDDGGKAEGVERDENGHVQVVCGAANVRAGLTVAWLPPGSTVPSTLDSDPFVLEARPLRGVVSNGMLASPKELSIGENHEGIMELDTDAAPGTPFAEAYELEGDVVIDMENKMFTHRPDCFGQLGIARELEGIQHRAYKSAEWYRTDPEVPAVEADELKLEVRNEVPELVPRFSAITLRDVEIKPSPVWLQITLSRVGIRPINNIVDYTNFFMIETGQPIHAYDYDKVVAQDNGVDHATIVVRKPKEGEKILLLNGKEIEPRAEAVMIATNDKLIGLGGVMGGGETEVDENTRNLIIEVANFDMYSIRRTSMAHGLFTDAVTRFNKGQSPLQTVAVLAKIVDEIRTFAGGKVAGALIDDNHLADEVMERKSLYAPVSVGRTFINERLGFDLSAEEMATLLRNVEFDIAVDGDELAVKAPFWRTDIAIPEDVVEEVGRLYGFDHLPLELPKRDLTPTVKDPMLSLKARVREILRTAGANELLTYSFVHGNLFDKTGQEREHAFRVSNALSPDLQYYRLSLTPSLLERVHPNIKAGFEEFVLFEINKAHNKTHLSQTENGLPVEFEMLALVIAASDKKAEGKQGAAYYRARKYLDFLAGQFGLELEYTPFTEEMPYDITKPFDLKRSALVGVKGKGKEGVIGMVGEYRQSVAKSLKLPQHTAGFEVGLHDLINYVSDDLHYRQLPRFPKVEQDISLRVDAALPYQQLASFVEEHLTQKRPDQTLHTLKPIDIYQSDQDADHKNVTLRLSIASYERTLTAEEVNALLDRVADAAKETLGAERL
jgi:phenylalanyl-tRNA synthetase beta chain